MRRTPNYAYAHDKGQHTDALVVSTDDITQAVMGDKRVSVDVRKKVKHAMKDMDAKMNVFFMAYAQKGAHRLSRLMSAIDSVDNELLQDWRLSGMDNSDLLELFSELSEEKHRTAKELLALSGKMGGKQVDVDTVFPDNDEHKISEISKRKITKFFNSKIVGK